MKTAVLGEVDDQGIAYNPKLLDLAAHYRFLPKACKPYRAKTKGKVERPFRYVREDFFLGRFILKHKTQSKRLTQKLKAMREEAWRLMHAPMAEQQRWYASVLRGHYVYYGLPHNYRALNAFHQNLRLIWFRRLRRRSQKARRLGWDQFKAMLERFPLPLPRITHPWAGQMA